ncbi:MAG: septum formation initiator family protein [Fidelibacterota bacterium]
MSYRRRRRRYRKVQRSPARRNIVPRLLLLAGLVLVVIFFFGDHGVYRLYEMKKEKERLLIEIENLKNQQGELEEDQQKLSTDLPYIEKLARDLHRMTLPEEKVFKMLPRPEE